MENKLLRLIETAKKERQIYVKGGYNGFHNDRFVALDNFVLSKLNSSFFKNRNARIIAKHFDELLPFIVYSNIDILFLYTELLMEQPEFREKFIEGLKNYPYLESIDQLFYYMSFVEDKDKFNDFFDERIFNILATKDLDSFCYVDILNRLEEEKQGEFLNILVDNKCDIGYQSIDFKGNNRQIIYDNLPLFLENSRNLYALMNFVSDNEEALSKVKDYIDAHEDKAINSIFCETGELKRIKDPTLKEIIKLMILDVKENENIKFSDITYNGGTFSRVLLMGDKVIKLGTRKTKSFPNNPYIIKPLLRKEFDFNGEKCFAEVTERVDTSKSPSREELYQLFKKIRDLGLVWTDMRAANIGRLKKDNIIHWREELDPTDKVLGFDKNRGDTVLKAGDLVILDADFIYDENDPNINYSNVGALYESFEKRYQSEKNKPKESIEIVEDVSYEVGKQKAR